MTPAELSPLDPAPQRALIGSRSEAQQAVQVALRSARRLVRCAHSDLSIFGLASPETSELLQTLLLKQRSARLRLLVDDPTWVEKHAARLQALQRRFSHAVEIRLAATDDPVGTDTLLIVDDLAALQLKPSPLPSGDLWLNNKPHVQPLATGFDRRWDAGAHNLPLSPLGLY